MGGARPARRLLREPRPGLHPAGTGRRLPGRGARRREDRGDDPGPGPLDDGAPRAGARGRLALLRGKAGGAGEGARRHRVLRRRAPPRRPGDPRRVPPAAAAAGAEDLGARPERLQEGQAAGPRGPGAGAGARRARRPRPREPPGGDPRRRRRLAGQARQRSGRAGPARGARQGEAGGRGRRHDARPGAARRAGPPRSRTSTACSPRPARG